MDWHRRTSPTSVDQSQPSVADKDTPPLVATGDLVVSSSVTHFGTRAFAVAGPKAWNQLPADAHTSTGVSRFLQDGTKVTFPLR